MPGLPPSALAVLDTAAGRFSEKPVAAAVTQKLDALSVRATLKKAARAAKTDQVPACLYQPGHGEPLVVLKANDLGELTGLLKKTEINGEGSRG